MQTALHLSLLHPYLSFAMGAHHEDDQQGVIMSSLAEILHKTNTDVVTTRA